MNSFASKPNSGSYVDGVYVTKNGYSLSGLACPKGMRLYDTSVTPAIYFMPEDRGATEDFTIVDDSIAKDVLPGYYAISNYGRVMNIRSEKILKPNYRPNGYEYLCMSADNCKNGQKKYNVHRMVMKAFEPREDMDKLQVNHIDLDKTHNYINKTMEDGTIQSNLEWCTPQENTIHRSENIKCKRITDNEVKEIREMHNQGYSYNQISLKFNISATSIGNICVNRSHYDPDYIPKTYEDSYKTNPMNFHKLTDDDAEYIRKLNSYGISGAAIAKDFYPNFSKSAINDIIHGRTHNRNKT